MPYYEDDYYRDDYYAPPRRYRRRRRRRGRVGLVIFALILLLALFFVWRLTDGLTTFAGPDMKNVQNELSYSLNTLAGEIRPEMAVNECGTDYVAQLESLASEEEDLAERLRFIADHIEIYTEEAVKTALQGGEKLDFALLMPFRQADDSGLNAVITVDEGEIPYLIQYDTRWGYHAYGSSVMGITACGPTCLSMVVIGLTGNTSATPARIADYAESAGHYVSGAGTAWSLFTQGAGDFGVKCETISTDEETMRSRLENGEIIIASMLPGDFTTSGHFIVIYDHGLFGFNVYDPNSVELSRKTWSFEKLSGQIAQLWSFSAASASGGDSLAGSTWYADCEEFITLRSAPSTSADAVTTIPKGAQMTYISASGEFVYVEYQGQRGYVLASYIARADSSGVVADPAAYGGEWVADCDEYVTLRSAPDAGAGEMNRIPRGASVDLLGWQGAFALVEYGGERGWALATYLSRPGEDFGLSTVQGTADYGCDELQSDLYALAAEFPGALSVSEIGRSVDGRSILAAAAGAEGAQFEVIIQAGIHGREMLSSMLAAAQLEHLLRAGVPEGVRFHFIAMVNPDGVEISRTRTLSEAQREIYAADLAAGYTDLDEDEYAAQWKANAAGVDINRNFSAGWAELDGRSAPSSELYGGAQPEDQPESRALAEYTRRVQPDATVSLHTSGGVIYAEYADAAVNGESRSLAAAVCALTGYTISDTAGLDAGGYKDYVQEALGAPGVTVELGFGANPQTERAVDSTLARGLDIPRTAAEWLRQRGA